MQDSKKSNKALVSHTLEFYRELEKRADANEHGVLVFEGQTTKVFRYLGISNAWYTPIMYALVESDSIISVQRGNKHQPSILVLRGEPTEEKISEKALTSGPHVATLVAALESRVRALEAWRESQGGLNVTKAMLDHERRLSRIEQRSNN